MGTANHYGHEGPDGSTPIQRMTAAGLPSGWTNWGENIAAGQSDPSAFPASAPFRTSAMRDGQVLDANDHMIVPGGAMTDWLNSPGHRANILFPFTHCGIGYAQVPGSQYLNYWVVDFALIPGDVPTPPVPVPVPVPPVPVPVPPVPVPVPTPTMLTIVTAKATGQGDSLLAQGALLLAKGGGFDGSLAVTDVQHTEVPPVPVPVPVPVPPVPTPDGDLTVTVSIVPRGQLMLIGVTVTGPEQIPASLSYDAHGQLPAQVLVNGGAVWGRLSGVSRGQMVTVTATQGIHSGRGSGTVP
jgi:hypothetical protein